MFLTRMGIVNFCQTSLREVSLAIGPIKTARTYACSRVSESIWKSENILIKCPVSLAKRLRKVMKKLQSHCIDWWKRSKKKKNIKRRSSHPPFSLLKDEGTQLGIVIITYCLEEGWITCQTCERAMLYNIIEGRRRSIKVQRECFACGAWAIF